MNTTAKMRYYQRLYSSALAFNILVALSFTFGFETFYTLVGGGELPQHPLMQLFIYLISFAIATFGFVYFQAGRRLPYSDGYYLLALCAIAKFSFGSIMLTFALRGDFPWGLMAVPAIDAIYGILFVETLLYKYKSEKLLQAQ